MSRFVSIVESIFAPASPGEAEERKARYPEVRMKEWVEEFLGRDDVRRNPDGSYDVDGDVYLFDMGLERLPVRFGKVGGSFVCGRNLLTSLVGAPREVGGDFWCDENRLISLIGSPKEVGGDFSCSGNRLASLVGSPMNVGDDFDCSRNRLTSLEGAPKDVGGIFWCEDNPGNFTKGDVREVCEVENINVNAMLESIFAPASPEEAEERKRRYPEVRTKEWMEELLGRDDVRRNPDGSYDVDGEVGLSEMGLERLPVRFGKVGGGFRCGGNRLVSLVGAPKEVGGHFWCSDNRLTSLEGAPEVVGGDFSCHGNRLVSLVGAPKEVGGDFWCSVNRLTSLEGAPKEVGSDFGCNNNRLTSLEGAPEVVGGDFWCGSNPREFTERDVREVCEVGGNIYV